MTATTDCPSEGCYIGEDEGLGITFGLLVAFALLGCLAAPVMAKMRPGDGSAPEFWYSARDSQGWPSIALSICATSAGAWMLYTPGEAALRGGWWGVLGYSVAIFLGPGVMCILAPKFREQLEDGRNITDWVGMRFGRGVQVYVTIVLVYYMFIYLVGQLKTMGDMTEKFFGKPSEYGIVPVALFTMAYTMVGGLPASIATDWVQAVAIMIFIVVIVVVIFTQASFSSNDWEKVSVWTDHGFDAFVALCFSIFSAEVFNLAFWQRIYASKDTRQLRIGFCVGGGMISLLTLLFGIGGLVLRAHQIRKGKPIFVEAFIFFEVLDMPDTTKGLRVLVFVLAICMIASCADSFQTAITSVVSREVSRYNLSQTASLAIGELLVVVVNVPAMIFAIHATKDNPPDFTGLAVKLTDLFGMADILTITLVVPIFAGVWPYVTTKGCIAGMASGILFILMWGWIEFGTFMAGMEMITLMCFGNTLSTSIASQPSPAMWANIIGECTLDGTCVQSPNYPSHYDASQTCTLEIDVGLAAPIEVLSFSTESFYDTLTVNGVAYSGTSGPPSGIVPTADVLWTSDNIAQESGWRLCVSTLAPPTPGGYSTTTCGPWYAWRSPIMFSMIPVVTGIVTYFVSWMGRSYELLESINSKLQGGGGTEDRNQQTKENL